MRKVKTIPALGVLLFLLLLVFSCEKNDFDSAQGTIILNLSTDTSIPVVTYATDIPGSDVNEYAVNIYKDERLYASFDKFSDIPENGKIRLAVGNYTFKAFYGEDVAAAFDSPYYEGVEEFSINGVNEISTVDVLCRLANVKLTINFSDGFKEAFKDYVSYRVDAYTENTKFPLQFSATENRSGYLKVAPIYLRVVLEKADGTVYDYGLKPIENVKARDHYIVMMKAKGSSFEEPTASINLEIHNETTGVEETVEIPFDMLQKSQPKIKLSFPATYSAVAKMPNKGEGVIAYINSDGALEDIVLSSDCALFREQGIPEELSFKNVLADAGLAEKLNNLGMTWDISFDGAAKSVIRLTGLLNNMDIPDITPVDNRFILTSTDKYGTDEVPFTITTVAPEYNFSMTEGDVWAKFAVIKEAAITKGDKDRMCPDMVYEYKKGDGEWMPFEFTRNATETIMDVEPNTQYSWRVGYRHFPKIEYTFTTESEVQVEYAGLEEWSSYTHEWRGINFWQKNSVTEWYVSNDQNPNKYWATLNPRTTAYRGGVRVGDNYTGYSGTREDTGYSGKGAVIETVGHGMGGSTGAWGTTTTVSPGMLFIGTYSFELGSVANYEGTVNYTKGRSFPSRPLKMQFWCKHSAYPSGNNAKALVVMYNGDTEIGRGSTLIGDMGAYNLVDVDIVYDEAYRHLRANKIYVMFASVDLADDDYFASDKLGGDYVKKDGRWVGSRLYVDEVKLIYDRER